MELKQYILKRLKEEHPDQDIGMEDVAEFLKVWPCKTEEDVDRVMNPPRFN